MRSLFQKCLCTFLLIQVQCLRCSFEIATSYILDIWFWLCLQFVFCKFLWEYSSMTNNFYSLFYFYFLQFCLCYFYISFVSICERLFYFLCFHAFVLFYVVDWIDLYFDLIVVVHNECVMYLFRMIICYMFGCSLFSMGSNW